MRCGARARHASRDGPSFPLYNGPKQEKNAQTPFPCATEQERKKKKERNNGRVYSILRYPNKGFNVARMAIMASSSHGVNCPVQRGVHHRQLCAIIGAERNCCRLNKYRQTTLQADLLGGGGDRRKSRRRQRSTLRWRRRSSR